MNIRWTFAAVILLLALYAQVARGDDRRDILDQKEELDQMRRDVEQGRQLLDSLQSAEKAVQSRISGHDQKIESDRKVIRRLNRELGQVQSDITRADSLLTEYQELLDRNNRRYLGNIRCFYLIAHMPKISLTENPNRELELHRKVVYLSALANYEHANIEEASGLLGQSIADLGDLTGMRKTIRGLKKDKETSFALGTSLKQKSQKDLDQIRRKSMTEADHVIMLETAAEEMADIIARLEEKRRRASGSSHATGGPSAFAGLQGHLPSPYHGTVILGYGEHIDEITRLKSFSPGITIQGRSGRKVVTVASGTVAFAGNLRGYGNFVIINHDHQYYTTYAGLGEVVVSEGQYLQTRSDLGKSGEDGIVRFELRRGSEPLDPVEWINIESL
ncbi:MAG: hypothetical protein DRP45_00455 [Candidatus Zixiibacteriota bacterium]|nr:MAG: hypothetical protein DRP45_00455 [candidate division Zixibacteria bacterium]